MGGNIKGITIEFKAKYTELDRAISKINKETTKLDRELKKVDKALKFNPGSVELWSQKQQILTQKISETESKLQLLKDKQQQLDAKNVDKSSEEYRQLQREIIECESKLKTFKLQLAQVGNVKLKALGEQFQQIGEKMKTAGQDMTRKFTAPIAAAYAASAKAALNFGDAMAKVSTIADSSEVSLGTLKKNILDLSNQSGKGASELAEATYQALSASVATKDVSKFLTQAVGLAKAGFLETSSAVDVLTTVINAYGASASDADKIANMLIQTQNDGKTTVDELAQAMGQVIPTAAALNIPLEQLSAGYVALTKQGINTANATTYLNGMFNELAKDGSTVSQILQQQTGRTFGELMAEGKTLGDVMQILNKSVDGNSEAFLNLWSNTRAGKGALALLNNGVGEFNTEVDRMLNSTGNVEDALNNLATPGAKARKALNSLVNAGIQIGDVLAPHIEKLAGWVQVLADKFSNLSPHTQRLIVTIGLIVAAIGPVLTVLGTLTSGLGAVIGLAGQIIPMIGLVAGALGLATPVLLGIVAGIAAVIAIGVALYKHWDELKAFALATWESIKVTIMTVWTSIQSFLLTVWNAIKAAAAIAWEGIKASALGPVYTLVSAIRNNWSAIQSATSAAWEAIKNAIITPFSNAYQTVLGIVDKIKSYFPIKLGNLFTFKLPHISVGSKTVKVGDQDVSVPTFNIDWYAKGGIFKGAQVIGVGENGPEAVVPLDKFWDKLDKMSTGETNINIYINGTDKDPKLIALEVKRQLIKEVNNRRLAWL